jgi:hypothetical protein
MRALILTVVALFVLTAPALGVTTVYVASNPGGGGDLLVSPVVFGGPCTIDYIYAGYWQMTVPDGDWPTEAAAREAHIWDTFFAPNYDAVNDVWYGYLDSDHGLTENCYFELWNYDNPGYAHGYATIVNQVDDADGDTVLDSNEGCIGALDGAIIVVQGGSGIYDGLCGFGYYFGSYNKGDCPPDFFDYQAWNFGMYIDLDPCSTPVENMSWGTIKALYQ